MLRVPGVTDGRSLASDALVEFVDIMPTLVDAAALAITAKRGNSGGEIGGGGDGGGGGENGGGDGRDGGGGTGGGLPTCPEKDPWLTEACTEGRSFLPLVTAATATTKSGRSGNGSYWKDAIFSQYPRYCSPLCSYMGYSILALRSSLPPLRQQTSSSGSSGSGSSSTKPVAGLDGEYDEAATVRFTAWVAFNSTSNTTNSEVPSSCGACGFEMYDHAQDEGENVNVACDWSKGSGGGGIPGSKVSRAYNDTAPLLFSRLKAGWRAV